MVCRKCGHEISPDSLICGYCGCAVPRENLSNEKKQELKDNARNDDSLKPNNGVGIRIFGIVLMIIGGMCDIIGMVLVGTGSLSTFTTVLVIGTISFFLGLIFTFAFRGY